MLLPRGLRTAGTSAPFQRRRHSQNPRACIRSRISRLPRGRATSFRTSSARSGHWQSSTPLGDWWCTSDEGPSKCSSSRFTHSHREDRGIGGPFVPRTRIAVLNRCGWKLPAARWVTTWYCLSSSLPSKQSEFDPPKGTTEPAVVGSGITWRPVGPLAGKVKRNLQDKVPGALADLERSRDAVATAMVRSASGRSTRLCSTLSSRMLSSLLQQVRL